MLRTSNQRDSFSDLVKLLRKLGASRFMHIPTVSNAFNLVDVKDLEKILERFDKQPLGPRK